MSLCYWQVCEKIAMIWELPFISLLFNMTKLLSLSASSLRYTKHPSAVSIKKLGHNSLVCIFIFLELTILHAEMALLDSTHDCLLFVCLRLLIAEETLKLSPAPGAKILPTPQHKPAVQTWTTLQKHLKKTNQLDQLWEKFLSEEERSGKPNSIIIE